MLVFPFSHTYISRDSGDSLFITQVPVSEVVRSVRRCHSKERSEFTCTIESEEESGDEDGPATPQRKQQVSQAMKHHKRKAEKHGLKKYSFPFLGSVYRSKPLSSREWAYRNTHLPLLNSVTFSVSRQHFLCQIRIVKKTILHKI